MSTIIIKENMTIRQKKKKQKSRSPSRETAFKLFAASRLLTQTEFFNDSTISCDIFCLQIVKQATALTNQHR